MKDCLSKKYENQNKMELLNRLLPLIGVIVGYLLSESTTTFRNYVGKKRGIRYINEELESIKFQLPQKEQLLKKARIALDEKKVIRMSSVNFPSKIYKLYWDKSFYKLDTIQRDNLHIIYEKLRLIDNFMDNYSIELTLELDRKIMIHPFETYKQFIDDMLRNLNDVKVLIKKYLSKEPIDIFYRKSNEESKHDN